MSEPSSIALASSDSTASAARGIVRRCLLPLAACDGCETGSSSDSKAN